MGRNSKYSNQHIIRGGALRPAERRCGNCGHRIAEFEFCQQVDTDESVRIKTFCHTRCPSDALVGSTPLAQAWAEANATLRKARTWYRLLHDRRSVEAERWMDELKVLGKRLQEAIEREEREVAASLVLGIREWRKMAPLPN